MKSLMLLRHAEALPATTALTDADRALSTRGQSQAQQVGACLQARAWLPQSIVCSSARRTQQTAEGVITGADWNAAPVLVDKLYNANVEDMLGLLREQSAAIEQLLLIAHAPGIGDLAGALCTRAADLSLACEPATLIEVVMNIASWADIDRNCGSLRLILPA